MRGAVPELKFSLPDAELKSESELKSELDRSRPLYAALRPNLGALGASGRTSVARWFGREALLDGAVPE